MVWLWIDQPQCSRLCYAMAAEPVSDAARILGERVRSRRRELGLSQEALGHQSGIHWSFIGQVERGQKNLSLHSLLRIAESLGVGPDVLVRDLRSPTT